MTSAGADRVGRALLLAWIAGLPLMRPGVEIGGQVARPVDLLFLLAAAGFALRWAAGTARPRWHPMFGLLVVWMVALATSLIDAPASQGGAVKLLTSFYLVASALLACWSIRSTRRSAPPSGPRRRPISPPIRGTESG